MFFIVSIALLILTVQDVTPSTREVILLSACTDAAGPEQARECIGSILRPCMASEPGGETTAGMVACTSRELAIWDERLNAAYMRMMAILEDTEQANRQDALRTAQRAWISFRDLECNQRAAQFDGGTLARVTGAGCVNTMTAERALQLESQLGDANR